MNTRTRPAIAAAIGLAAGVAAAVPFAIWWHRLPDPMAAHWGLIGPPNGSGAKTTVAAILVAPAAACGIAAAVLSLGRGSRRSRKAAVLAAIATIFAWSSWTVVLLNADAPDWHAAGDAGAINLGALAAGAVVGAVMTRLLGRPAAVASAGAPGTVTQARASAGMGPGELASWTGYAYQTWWLSAVLAAAAILVLVTVHSLVAVIPLAVLILAGLVFGWVRVTVDRLGLRVHYGLLPWPVTRIPLGRVMHCARIDVQPRGWGGYGYRGSRMVFRRSAVVLRAGDAIHLDLTDGSEFTVTVNGAAAGAGLLSDLAARASAG